MSVSRRPASIDRVIDFVKRERREVSICVIGGGMGGIAAGVKLVKAGILDFTIFEKSSGLGGTWWENTYPGVECDVPSYLYSYGFHRYNWSRSHADQREIQGYLEQVVDTYQLRSHFRFNTTVTEAAWSEQDHLYRVSLSSGESERFRIVVSAVGMFNRISMPEWPGMDRFTGPKVHTARWDAELDLRQKRVAVVGTGSSAAQVVAQIAPLVEHLLVFQRQPAWVLPKEVVTYSEEQRRKLAQPLRARLIRWLLRRENERGLRRGAVFTPGSKQSIAGEAAARRLIEREFADFPELRSAVTPTFPYPGKRPVQSSQFYPALKRTNVELIPRPVVAVTSTGVVDSEGREFAIDVLILATGFHAARYLDGLVVRGRSGQTLQEYWNGDPHAFLGITVPGFPNFFLLYGPNTNGGEILFMLERGAEHVVRVARRMRRRGVTAVEVRASWERRFNRWLQAKMHGTSWTMARNYFTSASGRVVTQWPFGAIFYGFLVQTIGRFSETNRRTGTPR